MFDSSTDSLNILIELIKYFLLKNIYSQEQAKAHNEIISGEIGAKFHNQVLNGIGNNYLSDDSFINLFYSSKRVALEEVRIY